MLSGLYPMIGLAWGTGGSQFFTAGNAETAIRVPTSYPAQLAYVTGYLA